MPATEPVLRRALACPAAVLAATGQTRERATGSRRMYGGRLVPPARELVRIGQLREERCSHPRRRPPRGEERAAGRALHWPLLSARDYRGWPCC